MIRTIAMKELRLMFASPLAWVVLAFLQFILALWFLWRVNYFLEVQPQLTMAPTAPGFTEVVVPTVFGIGAFVLLMVVPLLSMRLVAEERRSQTLPFLMSAPVSITQIVLGKFLGLVLFLALVAALTGLMCLSLYVGGRLDLGLLGVNLLGLLLMCGTFAAVGLYLSCLTAQPLVAAIGTYAVLLTLWLINISTSDPESILHVLSLTQHYESFSRGVIALKDAVYFVVLIVLFLLLSIRRLDADRLRA